ncbi:hypothetical protein [Micromonospora kangleipakensis]|nr:hypothetical protein [Micromonospora kangleipakensis]
MPDRLHRRSDKPLAGQLAAAGTAPAAHLAAAQYLSHGIWVA